MVASQVVESLLFNFGPTISIDKEALISYLVKHANDTYASNPKFAKRIRGNGGLDYLYTFMEHWARSWLKKNYPELYELLP